MTELLRLAVFFFALPILAVALATGLMSRTNPDEQQILSLIENVATFAAALGTAGIVVVVLAGRAARRKREWLIRLYGPLVSASKTATPFLVVSQVAVLVSLAAFFEVVLFGRVYGLLTIPSVVAALLWVGYRAAVVYTSQQIAMYATVDIVAPAGSPLRELLGRTAATVGVSAPEVLVAGFERDVFVTESANHIIVTPRGRTLYLSLPLCRILNREEISALIARELGAFSGLNGQLAHTVLPLETAAHQRLDMLRSHAGFTGGAWLATAPDSVVLAFVTEAFAGAVTAASRQRELEADQAGAAAIGPQHLGSALWKRYMFGRVWNDMLKDVKHAADTGANLSGVNLSERYAVLVRERASEAEFGESTKRVLKTATQAGGISLADRLRVLGISPSDIDAAVLAVAPVEPAVQLIDGYEGLEVELSKHYPVDIFLDLAEVDELWESLSLVRKGG